MPALRYEQQLQDLATQHHVSSATRRRVRAVLRSFDDCQGVPGVTPQVIQVLKQEAYRRRTRSATSRSSDRRWARSCASRRFTLCCAALAGMLIYIAFRFEWIYGVAAVIAVFHDTIITLGLFSIFNEEIYADGDRGAADSGRLLDE